MKTKNLNPQQLDQMYKHQEVVSARLQWAAIVTILSAIAIIAYSLELTDGFLTM